MDSDTTTYEPMRETGFSLYAGDIAKLTDAFLRGRIVAAARGEDFMGASFDVLTDGTVRVHIAGIDTVTL